MFDHFVGLALKGLSMIKKNWRLLMMRKTFRGNSIMKGSLIKSSLGIKKNLILEAPVIGSQPQIDKERV